MTFLLETGWGQVLLGAFIVVFALRVGLGITTSLIKIKEYREKKRRQK